MFILQENKKDANKRKILVDSSVKPDTAVKKAKLDPKAASANTAQGDYQIYLGIWRFLKTPMKAVKLY